MARVPNNTGRAARYWELAMQYRIYPKLLATIEDQKDFLKPAFAFSTGFRKDSRFQQYHGAGLDDFAHPEDRWFIRSFVTLTKVQEQHFTSSHPPPPHP